MPPETPNPRRRNLAVSLSEATELVQNISSISEMERILREGEEESEGTLLTVDTSTAPGGISNDFPTVTDAQLNAQQFYNLRRDSWSSMEVEVGLPSNTSSPMLEETIYANQESLNAAPPELLSGAMIQERPDGTYRVIRQSLQNAARRMNLSGSFAPSTEPLTKIVHTRLVKAMNALDVEKAKRLGQMQQLRGRREGQYIKLLRNEKRRNMTYIEIVGSEIPIKLSELGWNKVRNILDTIRLSEVQKKEGGNYELRCGNGSCQLPQLPYDFAYFCNNHLYCAEHVPDLKICGGCMELFEKGKVIKTYDEKLINVCMNCVERYSRYSCRGCGNNITLEYIQARVCVRCVDRNPHNSAIHSFAKSLKWASKDSGDIVKSSRIYSAEVEALSAFPDNAVRLHKLLPAEVGIAHDGSVTSNDGRAYGFELQTPRLSGKRGEELVHRMIAATKEVEGHVNESCGMHVHIDGQGLIPLNRKDYPAALIQMWKAYLVFEDVLMSLAPYSRRNNDFCRRLSEAFQVNELDTMETMLDVEKMWYKARTTQDIRNSKGQHYSSTRYFGVNFHCLLNDGHFEIRFHPGTLNSKKVLEWANLHILIADAAVRLAFTTDFLREAQATYHIAEKTHLLFDHIGMSKASKEFFLSRQRKFADKKRRDEETKTTGDNHRGNALTTEDNDNGL